jgi:hypothetical protein
MKVLVPEHTLPKPRSISLNPLVSLFVDKFSVEEGCIVHEWSEAHVSALAGKVCKNRFVNDKDYLFNF